MLKYRRDPILSDVSGKPILYFSLNKMYKYQKGVSLFFTCEHVRTDQILDQRTRDL